MKTPPGRALTIIAGTTVVCIGALWLLGFGFGSEAARARALGVEFLGSDVYFGAWITFFLMLAIGLAGPLLVGRLFLKDARFRSVLGLGDAKFGVVLVLGSAPLYLLLPLLSSHFGTEHYYTYLTDPGFTTPLHLAVHGVSYAAFAFGFEFLFRGFVLFNTASALGDTTWARVAASLVAGGLSALLLIGLPWVFPVSALVMCVPAGLLTLRARSMVYFAFIHWSVGVWSDVWEVVKLQASGSG